MVELLPAPEVVRCFFDDAVDPHLPAMCLHWPEEDAEADRVWELPEGVAIAGPAPTRFGIRISRLDQDTYAVTLLWERTCMTWESLQRDQLLTCDLCPLLAALGTDLWYLLDQPISPEPPPLPRAA
jgi:hypothetical protein